MSIYIHPITMSSLQFQSTTPPSSHAFHFPHNTTLKQAGTERSLTRRTEQRVASTEQYNNMATRRCSFLSMPIRLLFLVAVLGAVLHGKAAGVMASRPLLGIAEPSASADAVAAGPGPGPGPGAAVLVSGEGASRHDDRSEAGAEVILAGFAAALIVVIFCYIRITRESSSSSSVGVGEKHKRLGGF